MYAALKRTLPAMIGVAALLLCVPGPVVHAQPAATQDVKHRFISTADTHVNMDHIRAISRTKGDNGTTIVRISLSGVPQPLVLGGEDAEAFMAAFESAIGGHSSARGDARPAAEAPSQGCTLLAYDGFDGKLGLNWKPVRPDPSHVSLTRTQGALTVTTQRGSIHGKESDDQLSEGIRAKNLYMIDNPLAPGGEFVVTTCVSGFTPQMYFQQAGLIVYNDDDHYLKFGYEYDWEKNPGQRFCILTETDAKPEPRFVSAPGGVLNRFWLRLIKRGSSYEYQISTDGKNFQSHGTVEWGDGSPKQIGILAKNGGNKDATELDANFEFFELRSPAPAVEPGAK